MAIKKVSSVKPLDGTEYQQTFMVTCSTPDCKSAHYNKEKFIHTWVCPRCLNPEKFKSPKKKVAAKKVAKKKTISKKGVNINELV